MFLPGDKSEIEPHKTEFANKFRNGLAHEFFPKMAGISRVNDRLMTLSAEGYWVLDADILAKMFIESVDNLIKASEDTDFCRRVFERYNAIQERNLELINKPSTTTTTSTTRSGGATTTTLPYDLSAMATLPNIPLSKGDTGVTGLSDFKK